MTVILNVNIDDFIFAGDACDKCNDLADVISRYT